MTARSAQRALGDASLGVAAERLKTFARLGLALLLIVPYPARSQETPPDQETERAEQTERAQEAPSAQDVPAFDPQTLPDVVARVEGTEITRDQLVREARGAYQQLRQMGQEPDLDLEFYRTALDQLIASVLIHQEAESRDIAATDEEVTEQLGQIQERFPSPEAFRAALAEQDTSLEELRDEIEREISRGKYLEQVIAPQADVSEEQMRAFYEENLERMRQPERLKVRHILVELPEDASQEDETAIRQQALAILAEAKGGADFASLAEEHSDDETAEQGGELPWIARGQTLPAFESAAFALEEGEVSDLVESPLGFHIIKLEERQESRIAEYEEVEERVRMFLQAQEAQQILGQRMEELMASADIERFLPAG